MVEYRDECIKYDVRKKWWLGSHLFACNLNNADNPLWSTECIYNAKHPPLYSISHTLQPHLLSISHTLHPHLLSIFNVQHPTAQNHLTSSTCFSHILFSSISTSDLQTLMPFTRCDHPPSSTHDHTNAHCLS